MKTSLNGMRCVGKRTGKGDGKTVIFPVLQGEGLGSAGRKSRGRGENIRREKNQTREELDSMFRIMIGTWEGGRGGRKREE